MSDGVRDPRLERDIYYLYGWVTGTDGSRIGRRASDRATVDDAPSENPGQESTLTEFGGGEES